jgi:hypothetical protein
VQNARGNIQATTTDGDIRTRATVNFLGTAGMSKEKSPFSLEKLASPLKS